MNEGLKNGAFIGALEYFFIMSFGYPPISLKFFHS